MAPFTEPLEFDRLEEALEKAKLLAVELATAQVKSSGGVDIVTKLEVREMRSKIGS